VFLCVIQLNRAELWMHSFTSRFCSSTYVMQLGRNVQKWLQNSVVVPDNAPVHPADTVVNVFRLWEWEVSRHPPLFLRPQSVTMIWFPDWNNHCAVNSLQRGHSDSSATRGGKVNASADADGVRRLPHPWQWTIDIFRDYFEGR